MGMLITFEGIDGSGKTTQIRLLGDWLLSQGLSYLHTREPGGTMLGGRIRNDLLLGNMNIAPLAEAFLFLADRAQHFEQIVLPKLDQGHVVLVDRCIDSMIAYQGYGKHVGISFLEYLNLAATQGQEPNLTLLLDIEAESALDRKKGDLDRMEQLDLLRSARAAYISLAIRHSHRIKVIQADQSEYDIHRQIIGLVKKLREP